MSEGKVDRAKTLTMAAMEGSNKQAQSVHCVILARFEFCSGPKKKRRARGMHHVIGLPCRFVGGRTWLSSILGRNNQINSPAVGRVVVACDLTKRKSCSFLS